MIITQQWMLLTVIALLLLAALVAVQYQSLLVQVRRHNLDVFYRSMTGCHAGTENIVR